MRNKASIDPGKSFILHATPFKDTSMICQLLTEKHGKIAAVVNGAYSKKKRFLLAPFQLLWLELQGAGDLKKISKIEIQAVLPLLRGPRNFCGLYLNELLLKSIEPYCPVPIIFNFYALALAKLGDDKYDMAICLREFEMVWLEALGYALPFQQIKQPKYPHYLYCIENGFVGIKEPLANGFSAQELLHIANKQWHVEGVSLAAKKLLRQAMQPVIKHQKLQSRALWQNMAMA